MDLINILENKFFSQSNVIEAIVDKNIKALFQEIVFFDYGKLTVDEQYSFISQVRQSLVNSNLLTNEELCKQLLVIPDGFFYNDRTLKEFTIPDNVGIISDSAFANCASLRQITFSKSVKRIEQEAFANCLSLETIIFKGSEDDWMDIDFEDNWEYNAGLSTSKHHFQINYVKDIQRLICKVMM